MTWYFKSDLRLKGDVGWTKYDEDENDILEDAYQADKKTVKISNKYRVDFHEMLQYRVDDKTKQRDIKREDGKPKKKKKAAKESPLVGKKVFVVASKSDVIGVYATEDDADKAKDRSDELGVKVYEETIK